MDVFAIARAIFGETRRLLWKGILTLRAVGLKVMASGRAMPEIVTEGIRSWRGQTLAIPIAEQRQLLAEFYEKFEDLVELICDAGYAGDATDFQSRYESIRAWMLRAYPLLKPYISAHLVHDPSDAEFGLETIGRPTDACEALFCAERLSTVLEKDGGHLISRLERAQSGVFRYSDYLRGMMGE